MEETVDHTGKYTFANKNVTVAVACKPKYLYDISSTKWANDMYYTRLQFPEEHEKETCSASNDFNREELTAYVFLHDSLFQFRFMTIPEDYLRSI